MNKIYSPETDTVIYKNYGAKSLKKRKENKSYFLSELGMDVTEERMLLAIFTELSNKESSEVLVEALEGILESGIQVVIRAKGTKKYQEVVSDFESRYPGMISSFTDNQDSLRKAYSSSDISLFLGENYLEELSNSMSYGVIPVSLERDGLADFDPILEQGNSFIIKSLSKWSLFATIIRAKENFRFPYDWQNLQKEVMKEK